MLSSNSDLVWVLQKMSCRFCHLPRVTHLSFLVVSFQKAVLSRFQRGSDKLSYQQLLTGVCRLPFRTEESLRMATVLYLTHVILLTSCSLAPGCWLLPLRHHSTFKSGVGHLFCLAHSVSASLTITTFCWCFCDLYVVEQLGVLG